MQRQPIVAVLGHVDHGKTSLLDAVRKTNVVDREAGGITQSIGASVVTAPSGKKITFIDTPGHAAFTKMRGRGAKVADIAILVVASDDGVKPQTKEALELIKEAGIPYIVTATKTDVAGVNPESVRGQLEALGVLFEGRGGEVPFVPVSSKTGEGIDNLLDTIALLSEVSDVKGDPSSQLEVVVIETFKDKRGLVANLIVRNGKLEIGDQIETDGLSGKVRGIFDEKGKGLKEVLPGEPAQVIGLTEKSDGAPRKVLGEARRLAEDELPMILKATNAGALEAITASLPPKTVVVDKGIGEVTESDILNAKASGAFVIAFESKVSPSILKLASAEGVEVKRFEIIYELIQAVEDIFKRGDVEIIGKAEVLASFPFDKKKVAGSKVLDGKLSKGDKIILFRKEEKIGDAKIISLRKGKQEVTSVGQGEEFGAILEPQLDFNIGDVLASTR